MSNITVEQAEQQLAEAKKREEEANKPWVLKPPTMGDMQTFKNLIDDVERKHSELEDARQTLQDSWNDEVRTYNDAVSEFNSAQSSLADYINSNECIGNAEEYLAQEDEDNAVVVSDKLRQLLVNISEKADEFCTNDVEAEETDKYIEEADLSESHGVANDVHAQLETLQEYLDKKDEVDAEIKKQVEGWNWNLNQFEVYDEIREYPKDKIQALLQYACKFFNPNDTFKDLANHLNVEIDTDES
jgi:DNA repair exonuclease SbcCD ATPase subunit